MGTSIALVCYCCSNAYKYLCNHKLWTFFRNTTSNIQHLHTTNTGRRRERKQKQQQQMMMKMGLFSKIQVLLIFIGICQGMSLVWAKPLEKVLLHHRYHFVCALFGKQHLGNKVFPLIHFLLFSNCFPSCFDNIY